MWTLLISTVLTSAADCLNPIAITQQFVLQGMVKKPRHIWFFIIPTGVVNMMGGYLAYFGFITFIGGFFKTLTEKYGPALYTAELILGIAFLIGVCYLLQSTKIKELKQKLQALDSGGEGDEAKIARRVKSVSPMALIMLGVGATISELTTALPYFAFLAILFEHSLSLFQLTGFLFVYNIIYMSPLMVLYFVYIKAQDKFDRLYTAMKSQMTKWANIIAPAAVGLIGVFFVYHAVSLLLKQ
ncbi:MAG: GAP family protein [Oscillospiraceae bacterium]|jgi:hypothetical protein|nr:GAP family protein [Oscillospiraceae bacterium]